MKVPFLDLNRIHETIKPELEDTFKKVLNGSWYIGGGVVEKFESEFASYIGVKNCVSCANGTDALELILKAFEIGRGDEVIVPSFTWVSDAEAAINVGATPVFADIEKNGYTISSESVKSKITNKTKAVIAVHLYGEPADLTALAAICKDNNLKLIEDCAQAHGATFKGQKVGSIGDAAAFSFYPTKNLGAFGDGGAITTQDSELTKQLRLLTNHGQSKRDQHEIIGRNSRLDVMQAAFISVKLRYLDHWNEERSKLASIYFKKLNGIVGLELPQKTYGRVFHLFVIASEHRDQLKAYLEQNGIQTAIHYPKAIHQIPAYNSINSALPNSEKAAREVLSLPLYPGLSEQEAGYVIEEVRRFLEKKATS